MRQIVRLAKLRRCSRAQQFELEHDFQAASVTIRERPLRSSSFSHKITPEDARPLGRVIFFRDEGASLRHPGITGLI